MSSIHGYSVWLIPAREDAVLFKKCITALSARFFSPVFDPHVTLLGQIDSADGVLQEACADLAYDLLPLRLRLASFSISVDYFRSLMLAAEAADVLHQARRGLARRLGMPERPYEPHLSLLYGMQSAKEKEAAAAELPLPLPCEPLFASLAVVRTEGAVEQWEKVHEFIPPVSPAKK